ncbi:MAG: hypothetical protein JSW10_02180, partial [Pseudomonadota bacterium]
VTDVCLTENDRVARIPLGHYFPKRSYGIVVRKGKFLTPPARRFIDMMHPGFVEALDAGTVAISGDAGGTRHRGGLPDSADGPLDVGQ